MALVNSSTPSAIAHAKYLHLNCLLRRNLPFANGLSSDTSTNAALQTFVNAISSVLATGSLLPSPACVDSTLV